MEMRYQCGVHGEGGCRSVPYRSNTAGKHLRVAGGRLTIHNSDYRNRSCVTSWSGTEKGSGDERLTTGRSEEGRRKEKHGRAGRPFGLEWNGKGRRAYDNIVL
jgi:hypothetical protein